MPDYRDPVQIIKGEFTLLKFWHVVDGIYIWEFLISLDLEWDVIRGRRSYQPTFWIYVLARLATLAAVIINIVVLNVEFIISCQFTVLFRLIPAYLAFSATSLMLALRTIAVWNKRLVVVVIAMCIWLINGAFIIQHVLRIREARDDATNQCMALNVQATKMANIAAFVTDLLLFIIMVVGLLRLPYHRENSSRMRDLSHFLWNQGVIWVFVAIVFGIVPVVFSCLNLSDPLNMMFQYPWFITMTIATTRMYSTLQDFSFPVVRRHTYESPRTGGAKILIKGTRRTPSGPVPLSKISVDVQTYHDDSLTPNTSDGLVSAGSMER